MKSRSTTRNNNKKRTTEGAKKENREKFVLTEENIGEAFKRIHLRTLHAYQIHLPQKINHDTNGLRFICEWLNLGGSRARRLPNEDSEIEKALFAKLQLGACELLAEYWDDYYSQPNGQLRPVLRDAALPTQLICPVSGKSESPVYFARNREVARHPMYWAGALKLEIDVIDQVRNFTRSPRPVIDSLLMGYLAALRGNRIRAHDYPSALSLFTNFARICAYEWNDKNLTDLFEDLFPEQHWHATGPSHALQALVPLWREASFYLGDALVVPSNTNTGLCKDRWCYGVFNALIRLATRGNPSPPRSWYDQASQNPRNNTALARAVLEFLLNRTITLSFTEIADAINNGALLYPPCEGNTKE